MDTGPEPTVWPPRPGIHRVIASNKLRPGQIPPGDLSVDVNDGVAAYARVQEAIGSREVDGRGARAATLGERRVIERGISRN